MKRKSLSNEKRCYCKTLWLRYIKKEKTFRKTKEMKEKNETIWESKFAK